MKRKLAFVLCVVVLLGALGACASPVVEVPVEPVVAEVPTAEPTAEPTATPEPTPSPTAKPKSVTGVKGAIEESLNKLYAPVSTCEVYYDEFQTLIVQIRFREAFMHALFETYVLDCVNACKEAVDDAEKVTISVSMVKPAGQIKEFTTGAPGFGTIVEQTYADDKVTGFKDEEDFANAYTSIRAVLSGDMTRDDVEKYYTIMDNAYDSDTFDVLEEKYNCSEKELKAFLKENIGKLAGHYYKNSYPINLIDLFFDVSATVSKPNSAGGVTLSGTIKNKTDKEIKYVTLGVEVYNAVGDEVDCEIRDYQGRVEIVGPIAPNKNKSFKFSNEWYNGEIRSCVIVDCEIEYMDGTKIYF